MALTDAHAVKELSMLGNNLVAHLIVHIQGPVPFIMRAAQYNSVLPRKHIQVSGNDRVLDLWLGQQKSQLPFYRSEFLIFKQGLRTQSCAVEDQLFRQSGDLRRFVKLAHLNVASSHKEILHQRVQMNGRLDEHRVEASHKFIASEWMLSEAQVSKLWCQVAHNSLPTEIPRVREAGMPKLETLGPTHTVASANQRLEASECVVACLRELGIEASGAELLLEKGDRIPESAGEVSGGIRGEICGVDGHCERVVLQQSCRGKPYDTGAKHRDRTAMSGRAKIDREPRCSP